MQLRDEHHIKAWATVRYIGFTAKWLAYIFVVVPSVAASVVVFLSFGFSFDALPQQIIILADGLARHPADRPGDIALPVCHDVQKGDSLPTTLATVSTTPVLCTKLDYEYLPITELTHTIGNTLRLLYLLVVCFTLWVVLEFDLLDRSFATFRKKNHLLPPWKARQ